MNEMNTSVNNDGSSKGIAILCFFLPVVGLILWLTWKEKKPLKAKSAAKGAVTGFVIGLIFSIPGIISENKSGTKTSSTSSAEANKTTIQQTITQQTTTAVTTEAKISKDEYVSQCKTYSYKEIARNPEQYKGENVKFEGEVIQVLESNGVYELRVNITKDKYGQWSDTIYIVYNGSADKNRILEDDVIALYGKFGGMYKYESIMGSEITLPIVYAEYIDIKQD